MPPLRMNRSVQSTDHSNVTERPLLLLKPRQKIFIIIIFQSETCCKPTLVTRYFSGKVSDVTQSNYSSTTNIDA